MAIRLTTPRAEIDAYLQKSAENLRRAALRALAYCGERCVNEARQSGSYTDRTGNLRSSTGYVLVENGQVAQEFFPSMGKGNGMGKGQDFARSLVAKFPKGLCLIVVAGMNYASYVENRGYDVLASAELLADRVVPSMLKQLKL